MIRKKVLSIGSQSATMLVATPGAADARRVLHRINVSEWTAAEVEEAVQFYQTLQHLHIPFIVHVDAVERQEVSMHVVTAYCPKGDVAAYLEGNEVRGPLPELVVVRWLLDIAAAVHELHKQAQLPYYGLSLKHIFLIGEKSGQRVIVGLPQPASMYFRKLADRVASGIAPETEYPPEVIRKQQYHPTLSDVWHLGRVGSILLETHAEPSSRSASLRALFTRMTAESLAARVPLEDVIAVLSAATGETPTRTAPPPATSAPPVLHRGNKAAAVPTTRAGPATDHSAQDSDLSSESDTPPLQGSHNSSLEALGHTTSQSTEGGRGAGAPRGQRGVPDSWRRKAEARFEALQRLNASPMRRPLSRHASPNIAAHRAEQQADITDSANAAGRHSPVKLGAAAARRRSASPLVNIAVRHAAQPATGAGTPAFEEAIAKRNAREKVREELLRWRRQQLETERRAQKKSSPQRRQLSPGARDEADRATEAEIFLSAGAGTTSASPHHNREQAATEATQSADRTRGLVRPTPTRGKGADVPVTVAMPKRPPPLAAHADPLLPSPPPHADGAQGSEQSSPLGRGQPLSGPTAISSSRSVALGSSAAQQTPPAALKDANARGSDARSRRSAETAASLSSITWTADGLRGAVRSIVPSRALYGQLMASVATFASLAEEERTQPRCNEIFMRQLHSLLPEDRLFLRTAPLCVQLAALEGLRQTLRSARDDKGQF